MATFVSARKLSLEQMRDIVDRITVASGSETRYRLDSVIQRGGFGAVCRGVDLHIVPEEIIAIKVIPISSSTNHEHLKREVENLRLLNHPHIAALKDSYNATDYLVFAMQLAPGNKDLFEAVIDSYSLRKPNWFPESIAKIVFAQIGSAIAYIHRKGIVHRDIKPENIRYDEKYDSDGYCTITATLLDFGLSKNTDKAPAISILGTPAYIAPEIIRGTGAYTGSCDVWSLAVCMSFCSMGSNILMYDVDTDDRLRGYSAADKATYKKQMIELRAQQRAQLFPRMSQELQHLLGGCLDPIKKYTSTVRQGSLLDSNPDTRLTAEMMLQHPWFAGVEIPLIQPLPAVPVLECVIEDPPNIGVGESFAVGETYSSDDREMIAAGLVQAVERAVQGIQLNRNCGVSGDPADNNR